MLDNGAFVRVRGPRNQFELRPAPAYLVPSRRYRHHADLADGACRRCVGPTGRGTTAVVRADRWPSFDELDAITQRRLTVHPQDEVGLIDLPGILADPLPDTLVYACGPERLLEAVEKHPHGWPAGNLQVERFSPRNIRERRAAARSRWSYRRGRTLTVPPERSILEVAEDAGIPVLFSCREGTCGTCETPVLEGAVDHRDSLLSQDERDAGDVMFICVSRTTGPRLVLDV